MPNPNMSDTFTVYDLYTLLGTTAPIIVPRTGNVSRSLTWLTITSALTQAEVKMRYFEIKRDEQQKERRDVNSMLNVNHTKLNTVSWKETNTMLALHKYNYK